MNWHIRILLSQSSVMCMIYFESQVTLGFSRNKLFLLIIKLFCRYFDISYTFHLGSHRHWKRWCLFIRSLKCYVCWLVSSLFSSLYYFTFFFQYVSHSFLLRAYPSSAPRPYVLLGIKLRLTGTRQVRFTGTRY